MMHYDTIMDKSRNAAVYCAFKRLDELVRSDNYGWVCQARIRLSGWLKCPVARHTSIRIGYAACSRLYVGKSNRVIT